MNLAELDALLARFIQAEQTTSSNLVELEDQATYKLLLPATLTGVTAERVAPALAGVPELWSHFSLFEDLVQRARDLRGDEDDLPAYQRAELERLLTGPSITVSVDQVPLAARDLSGAAQTTQTTTPQALLDGMSRAFEAARDGVFAVDEVWRDTVPRLDRASQQAAALRRRADTIGVTDVAELHGLRSRIDAVMAAVASDPLGARADFDGQVAPALDAAERVVGDLARQRDALPADFARAAAEVDELAALVPAGQAALAETTAKIAAPAGLLQPLLPAVLDAERDGLRPWLARLVAIRDSGDWRVARRGLDQFLQTSDARLDAARRIVDANRAPLERRNELRGLLDAYKVKASARRLAEDGATSARYTAARECLYTAPTDLAEAERLVAAYGAAIDGSRRPGATSEPPAPEPGPADAAPRPRTP